MNPLKLLAWALLLSADEDVPIRDPIPARHGPAGRAPSSRRGPVRRGGTLRRLWGRIAGRS